LASLMTAMRSSISAELFGISINSGMSGISGQGSQM